ncbi:MAG: hypothetical protein V1667_02320 [bacterium]
MLNPKQEIDEKIKNYQSVEGITTKQLEIGLWFVEHKRQLKNCLIYFLILVSAISWSYTIYGFAYYIARGMGEDEILIKQMAQINGAGHDYVARLSAKDLAIGPVEVIKSSEGKYDLYANLKNDNAKWLVEFEYYFTAAGRSTEKTKGYILPDGERYLAALAESFPYYPENSRLVVENIKWSRINQHEIPDWEAYKSDRLNIGISGIEFVSASNNPLSEKMGLNRLSFNAVNRAAYNYWSVGFTILLYSGGEIIGINHYILDDFMSGQNRSVEISWPGNLGGVSSVEIIPEINIMEDGIYIKYEGGIGQEK